MKISNLKFLPYTNDSQIKSTEMQYRILRLLTFFTESSINALNAYCQHSFTEFDPQVSDNLCQIRAYQFLSDFSKVNYSYYQKRIEVLQKINLRCKKTILQFHNRNNSNLRRQLKYTPQKVMHFVRENELFYLLSAEEFFIVSAYILTKYRAFDNEGIPKGIDYKTLCHNIAIPSVTFASKLTHNLQRIISKNSCKFIYKIARLNAKTTNLSQVLKKLEKVDEIKRHILPSYWATDIIMANLIEHQQDILLFIKLRERCNQSEQSLLLPLRYNKLTQAYELYSQTDQLNYQQPAIVFQSIAVKYQAEDTSTFITRLFTNNIYKLIMLNMAMHPQYPSKTLAQFNDNPLNELIKDIQNRYSESFRNSEQHSIQTHLHYIHQLNAELEQDKKLCIDKGCYIEKPSLFLIKHIYTSTIDELLRNHNNTSLCTTDSVIATMKETA